MTLIFTRWFAAIILTLLPALVPAFAYAVSPAAAGEMEPPVASVTTDSTPSTSITPIVTTKHVISTKANITTSALTALHNRCDMQITTRLASLNQASTRLDAIKKLTDAQKQQYTTAIQTNISGLTSLKAKCDADTDAATLEADTKSIVTSYRIYLEFMPQTALLAATDRLNDISSQFTIVIAKLQSRITEAQGQGDNVTSLQATLTDLQAKIADVATQTATITTQVGSLQPANVNTDKSGTKTDFKSGRTALQAAQMDVKAALADVKLIVKGLEAFKPVTNKTGTPSAATTNAIVSPTAEVTVVPSTASTTQ